MGGVSGAFLLLPFQMSILGFSSPAVSATNHLFNIVAIPSGVWRYSKEGRMVWPLTLIIIVGTLPGVLIGALLRVRYLSDPQDFKLFVGLVLLYLGSKLALDLLRKEMTERSHTIAEERFRKVMVSPKKKPSFVVLPAVSIRRFDALRLIYEFCDQKFDLSVPRLMLLSVVVGALGGIYGIGGGAFIAPFLVTFFGIPVYTAAGAALMGTFVTSVAGVLFYQLLAPLYPNMTIGPDWALGFAFGVGGAAGMYCGAMLQKFVSARLVKAILAISILIPALVYIRPRQPVN
jgi:uncharacterized membrane protein YfcA